MTELESLSEQRDKPLVYASLLHGAQTDDPRTAPCCRALRSKRRPSTSI